MEISIKSINDQMCRVHFAVKEEEVQDIYNKFCHSIDEINFEKEKELFKTFACAYIETELLEDALLKAGIVSLPMKDVRYLTDFKVGKMIIGVAIFPRLPAPLNLTLPRAIEYNDEEYISNYVKERFKKALIDNGMYEIDEINKVKKDSLVKYNINYLKDNVVINTLEDQEFDMNVDDDFDSNIFLGAKKGDIILLDEDEITTRAVIKNIYEKRPYGKKDFSEENLKEFGFVSYDLFYETYDDFARSEIIAEKIIEQLCDSIIQKSDIVFSDELLSFYVKKTNKDILTCKRNIIIEYLSRVIDIQEQYQIDEDDLTYLLEMINLLNLDNNLLDVLSDDMNMKLEQYKIIKVLYEKGIIADPIF